MQFEVGSVMDKGTPWHVYGRSCRPLRPPMSAFQLFNAHLIPSSASSQSHAVLKRASREPLPTGFFGGGPSLLHSQRLASSDPRRSAYRDASGMEPQRYSVRFLFRQLS
jgi:hypothetical protein